MAAAVNNTIVVILAIVAVGLVVYPYPVSQYLKGNTDGAADPSSWIGTVTTLIRLLHILGFASNFGASLWVSFIGGFIMFKHLPRHQFGNLQAYMFPAYFRLSAVSNTSNVAMFAILHPWTSSTVWEKAQVGTLGLTLFFTLANLLVMEPITTKLMRQRHRSEKEDGISTEAGVVRKQEIEKASPKLRSINKKFMAAHGVSSLLNLFAFLGQLVHAVYLSGVVLV